ncbi:TIR domain-containing protein [Sorangium sp. So ce375]|uniref:TIR domain-containing protein n=1 Tax=Sorangium sp. So ce375 TaxID=3133306 RepID=UPI003F5B33B8
MPAAVDVFFIYSHKDERLRDELATHLRLLERAAVIRSWHDRRIGAGEDWRKERNEHLEKAQVILLLVSSDFLASDYCYDVEMKRALARCDSDEARVLPVILRDCMWSSAPFARLHALPKDAKPITSWRNRDEAWTNVVRGIDAAVRQIAVPALLSTADERRSNASELGSSLLAKLANAGARATRRFSEVMTPNEYQIFAAELMRTHFPPSYEVELLKEFTSTDGQRRVVDVYLRTSAASAVTIEVIVECKRLPRSVEVQAVENLVFRRNLLGVHKAVFVTNVGYEMGAIVVARAHGVALIVADYERDATFVARLRQPGNRATPRLTRFAAFIPHDHAPASDEEPLPRAELNRLFGDLEEQDLNATTARPETLRDWVRASGRTE